MNAELTWVEALKRQLWKVHCSKTAPEVVHSLKSTAVKVQSASKVFGDVTALDYLIGDVAVALNKRVNRSLNR